MPGVFYIIKRILRPLQGLYQPAHSISNHEKQNNKKKKNFISLYLSSFFNIFSSYLILFSSSIAIDFIRKKKKESKNIFILYHLLSFFSTLLSYFILFSSSIAIDLIYNCWKIYDIVHYYESCLQNYIEAFRDPLKCLYQTLMLQRISNRLNNNEHYRL